MNKASNILPRRKMKPYCCFATQRNLERWLLLLWIHFPISKAQIPFGDPPPTMTTSTLPHRSAHSSSHTEASITVSSIAPIPTNNNVMHATARPDDDDNANTLVKYYYVFIAIFVILLGIIAWAAHRRRRKKMYRTNQNRHFALSQDLDGWPNNRRWVQLHRPWRTEDESTHNRGDDGLDERGEAPPPYKKDQPPYETSAPLYPASGSLAAESSHAGLDMPAPAVISSSSNTMPPDYDQTVRASRYPERPGQTL